MIIILITYVEGTSEILDTCLSSLERHKAGAENEIRVITDGQGWGEALEVSGKHTGVMPIAYDIGQTANGSEMHGKLLDVAIEQSDSEYILTLDSDCFPVADGWLGDLLEILQENVMLSGILWPWVPPPKSISEATLEYRIRRNHCWNNTQTTCQLVRKSFIVDNRLSFTSGDDTGFAICEKVHQLGGDIKGFMPSCCALPNGDLNPEMNRHACLIYGDKIYHQGGTTRKLQGAIIDPLGFYNNVRKGVFIERGAEWILSDGNHHNYNLDREEDVAQFKMRLMFNEMARYLTEHDRLFNPTNC
jgi:hypothetical protein